MKRISASALSFAIVLLSQPLSITSGQNSDRVREYRRAHEAEIILELADLLSIPNVASDTTNIQRNASKLIELMSHRGIQARLLKGDGPPAIFGELKTPGATRTIGFYAHYDGQPVEPSKWASDPFKPTLRDKPLESGGRIIPFPKAGEKFDPEWRLYARSASDDKAPIVALLAALDALKASNAKPTVNLKFLFDGEEEAGSPHLGDITSRNAGLLGADVWICADGPVHQSRRQQIYFGLRGIVKVDITVYGANRALHSGHYGNWSPNPAMRLAKLLASMKDNSGRVLIQDFYDGAQPLGEEEKKALKEMPATDVDLMREYGLAATDGSGRALAELINEPSLNIDGLRSEDVGRQSRTIIPAEATATIDLRLVKGITPRTQVERLVAHIKKQGYFVTTTEPDAETRLKHHLIARVLSEEGYPAVRTPMSLPIVKSVINAVEQAIGQRPVMLPTMGGSGPLWAIDTATKAPQVGVPIVNHDNNQHSSNENLRIQNLWNGIEIFAALMEM
ncbi:MAG TPA: M20/M25/M40 family metallo-hydrolase [Blastocatellia bacterium]|nr:M20/M25/M40 family metallo-hydrolase [Blastocatellia bacterium]